MKFVFGLALLLVAGLGLCATRADRVDYCNHLSGFYTFAANMRDGGLSPQQVWGSDGAKFALKTLRPDVVKEAINNVYFNRDFAMPAWQISDAVSDACLNPRVYHPLK